MPYLAHGPVSGGPPARASVEAALHVLVEQLGRYCRACLCAMHFGRVLLCEELVESGLAIPRLPSNEYRGARLGSMAGPVVGLSWAVCSSLGRRMRNVSHEIGVVTPFG